MNKRRLIFLILLIGLIVRVWGLDFGLPAKRIIDEESSVYWALYAGQNNLQVGYVKGPFIPFFLLGEYSIIYFIGRVVGVFQSPFEFLISLDMGSS